MNDSSISVANSAKARVLIIDDDEDVRCLIGRFVSIMGHDVTMAPDGKEGIELFRAAPFDVVIVDLLMPRIDGIKVVQEIYRLNHEAVIFVMTAGPSIETCLMAMEEGATDYLVKPLNRRHLELLIQRHLRYRRATMDAAHKAGIGELLGASRAMREVYRQIESAAISDMIVLLEGETGTGKELAARAIHETGPRRNRPFIAVNCGGLPEQLLESELFGHRKGSFTGATNDKRGLFEAAEGGTLLLDEIEAAPPSLQVVLLRVLDQREILPVGSLIPVKVDVKIIAASNRNLEAEVREKRLREDLFHRLCEYVIQMPPFRERMEDLPILAAKFFAAARKPGQRKNRKLSPKCQVILSRYSWPGNVREFKNLLLNLAESCPRSIVHPADLPSAFRERISTASTFITLREREKQAVAEALLIARDNKADAARLLGVSRKTVYALIVRHGLSQPTA